MIERFKGTEGKRRLVSELCTQTIILGDNELALVLADVVELRELHEGDILIEQGAEDTDTYLVIVGSFTIEVNGREVAARTAGTHVGEMASIDIKSVRSATVIAASQSVVAKISEPNFIQVANNYPKLWRQIAIELCNRLRNRNDLIRPPNNTPNIFVCSSSERLPYAESIQLGLDHHHSNVILWSDGVFNPMKQTMEDLAREVDRSDFGIALVMDEDVVRSRGKQVVAPRDNVVFELGLFMGKLGRERTIIVSPRGVDLKLPSDLLGLNQLQFNPPANPNNLREMTNSLAPVTTQLKSLINKLGSL